MMISASCSVRLNHGSPEGDIVRVFLRVSELQRGAGVGQAVRALPLTIRVQPIVQTSLIS